MKQEGEQQAVMNWLHDHEAEMFALLKELVDIDSGSNDKEGVDHVQDTVQRYLNGVGIETKVFPCEKHGNCLLGEVAGRGEEDAPHVLLLGHMDTVFPKGTVSKRPFRIEGNVAYGAGVADMKAGIVMNTFVARAFSELAIARMPIRVFYTGDEEVASPSSRELTIQMATGAEMVFNSEPGRLNGNVVVERKGCFFIDFEVNGIAAHAGVNHDKGASAIEALARKIIDLHDLTDYEQGITTNIGAVQGGVSINTVAPHVIAQLDVRFPGVVDRQSLHDRIVSIIETETVVGTSGQVTHEGGFLPLSQNAANRALLVDYQNAAAKVGFAVRGEATGGSADSGLTVSVGAPTLCATGPIGSHFHTPDEFCRLDSMVPRAQAIALTILGRSTPYCYS
jgi:glutamate carboxypeptidase